MKRFSNMLYGELGLKETEVCLNNHILDHTKLDTIHTLEKKLYETDIDFTFLPNIFKKMVELAPYQSSGYVFDRFLDVYLQVLRATQRSEPTTISLCSLSENDNYLKEMLKPNCTLAGRMVIEFNKEFDNYEAIVLGRQYGNDHWQTTYDDYGKEPKHACSFEPK